MQRSTIGSSRQGVTLIEILVVTGILGILTLSISSMLLDFTRQSQSLTAKNEFNGLVNSMQSVFNNTQNCTAALAGVRLNQDPGNFPQDISMSLANKTLTKGVQDGQLKITNLRFLSKTDAGAANQFFVNLELEADRSMRGKTAIGGNLLRNEFELVITVQPPFSSGSAPIIGCAGKFNSQWVEAMGGITYLGGNVGVGTTAPAFTLDVNGTARAVDIIYNSDSRLKQNVREIPDALDRVLRLRGVLYDWKNPHSFSVGNDRLGVLAQEVEEVFPEVVSTEPRTGLKSVSYANLVAPLIEALKEQHKLILKQQREIEEIRKALGQRPRPHHGQ